MKTLKTSEAFAVGTNKIEWVGSTFKEHFYDTTFKEAKLEGLQTKTLSRSMTDAEIMQELKPQAVTLGDVLTFLSQADRKEWYIFYVNDPNGTLWAVRAYWRQGDGGWNVEARSVERPDGWLDGVRVVSRDFTKTLKPIDPQSLSTSDALPDVLTINNVVYDKRA